MLRFWLVLLCFSVLFDLQAQNITISGKVVDKQTKEPLVFASVGIKGKAIGTITNLQGEFDFHLTPLYKNEILAISILGYSNFGSPVWQLTDKSSLVIEMERKSYLLEEVVVSDTLSGSEIFSIAVSRIDVNYPSKPFLLDGFYRDIKKVGGTYISLLEAAARIYDEDYLEPRNKFKLRERVALQEVRRSLGYGNKFTSYFDQDNLLEDLLLHNSVRYRQFPEDEAFIYNLVREKDSYYDGREIFVITYQKEYLLRLYIDKVTFGIIHLELEDNQHDLVGRKKGMESRFVSLKKTIDYKFFEGKLFLNYITMESRINWYDLQTNEFRFETDLQQQLLINEVTTNTSEWIDSTEKMRRYGLQYQDLPYNKEFWASYNVIKESPLDRKVIQDLEKLGPLEKQFEEN